MNGVGISCMIISEMMLKEKWGRTRNDLEDNKKGDLFYGVELILVVKSTLVVKSILVVKISFVVKLSFVAELSLVVAF